MNDKRHGREEQDNDQCQPPVEVDKIASKGQKRQHVPRQLDDGVHQQRRAVVHLVDNGVGNGTRRLVSEERESHAQQFVKHGLAKFYQTVVSHFRECELRQKARKSPYGKEQHQCQRNQP